MVKSRRSDVSILDFNKLACASDRSTQWNGSPAISQPSQSSQVLPMTQCYPKRPSGRILLPFYYILTATCLGTVGDCGITRGLGVSLTLL